MYVFGVADLAKVLEAEPDALKFVPGKFTRAVVFGMPLQNAVLDSLADRPTPLYFHLYRQVNYQLDSVALVAASLIQNEGFRAVAIAASQLVSHEPMQGHVSHRLLGWAAGLGWRGKNNLLVNPKYGSRVRYVSVLTDAPIEPDAPVNRDCGRCAACISACPAEAIRNKPEDFGLDRCYQKLCEFARIPFVGQHVCGICQKACFPANWPK
jgi:epoxyqueuosine reductase QueG